MALIASFKVGAVLGPIPIYLNTEYRTSSPVIGSISSTLSFNKSDIQSSGANTFGDFLATMPGVEYESGQGNLTALRIRGNEAAHTLLLINGAKVTISATQANLDVVPLDVIEKIEIIKGPFSSLYGPGAIGGVIHLTTNKKQSAKSGNLNISYATHNTKKITLNANNRNENSYLNIALSDYHTDGINATTQDVTGEKDSIDRKSIAINIGTELSETTDIEVNFLNTRATIEYDDLLGNIPRPDNNLTQFNLKTTHQFSKYFKANLDLRRQNTQRRSDKYKLNGITLLNEYNVDDSKISFGLENESDQDIGNSKYIKHHDIFTQYQANISGNDIVIGYRNIDHDKFSKHNTYNFGWGRNINNNLRFNAAFGKATNLPNHFQNNLNITQAKTALKPEHSKSIELGVKYQNINARIYQSKTNDAFSYFDPDNNFNTDNSFYINQGGIENKGIELGITSKFANWNIVTNATYQQSIDSETKLEQGRRPNKTFNIVAKNKQDKFNYKIQLIAKSATFDHDDNTTRGKNPGYALVNLAVTYHYNKKTSISLTVNNALDKSYTIAKTANNESYNQLGRTLNLGLDYGF